MSSAAIHAGLDFYQHLCLPYSSRVFPEKRDESLGIFLFFAEVYFLRRKTI